MVHSPLLRSTAVSVSWFFSQSISSQIKSQPHWPKLEVHAKASQIVIIRPWQTSLKKNTLLFKCPTWWSTGPGNDYNNLVKSYSSASFKSYSFWRSGLGYGWDPSIKPSNNHRDARKDIKDQESTIKMPLSTLWDKLPTVISSKHLVKDFVQYQKGYFNRQSRSEGSHEEWIQALMVNICQLTSFNWYNQWRGEQQKTRCCWVKGGVYPLLVPYKIENLGPYSVKGLVELLLFRYLLIISFWFGWSRFGDLASIFGCMHCYSEIIVRWMPPEELNLEEIPQFLKYFPGRINSKDLLPIGVRKSRQIGHIQGCRFVPYTFLGKIQPQMSLKYWVSRVLLCWQGSPSQLDFVCRLYIICFQWFIYVWYTWYTWYRCMMYTFYVYCIQ